jgi:hypothetical protein
MAFRPAVHVPLLFVAFGAIFASAGVWFLLDTGAGQRLERGAALEVVSATALATRPIGDVVLLQGRVAAGTPAVFRDFVAVHRERFDGMSTGSGSTAQRERWSTIEVLTPPLTIAADGGAVSLATSGYDLRAPLHYWRDTPTDFQNDLLTTHERASGFAAGDVVTVEGRVVAAADGGGSHRALAATVVSGGDAAAYLVSLSDDLLVTKILGSVFTGLGAIVMAVAGLIAWRSRRAPVRARA